MIVNVLKIVFILVYIIFIDYLGKPTWFVFIVSDMNLINTIRFIVKKI